MSEERVISYSQIQDYISCPCKWFYKYIMELQKIEYDRGQLHKDFGSAIHQAIDHLIDTKNLDEALEIFSTSGFEDLEDEKCKTKVNGLECIRLFYNFYQHNFSEWETLESEQLNEIQLSDKVKYKVKTDRIIRWKGNIYVVDFKTTTSKSKNQYLNGFELSRQVLGYSKYCMDKYASCSGFIPVVLFMGYRERCYKGEPAGFWCRPEWTIINKTKEQIEDFVKDTCEWHKRLSGDISLSVFPRKYGDSCEAYGSCEFKEICLTSNDPYTIETLYTHREKHE